MKKFQTVQFPGFSLSDTHEKEQPFFLPLFCFPPWSTSTIFPSNHNILEFKTTCGKWNAKIIVWKNYKQHKYIFFFDK